MHGLKICFVLNRFSLDRTLREKLKCSPVVFPELLKRDFVNLRPLVSLVSNDCSSRSIKLSGLINSTCATKPFYLRTMNGVGSNNVRGYGTPIGIQAILESGH